MVMPICILFYVKIWLPWIHPNYEDDPVLGGYYKGENARNLFNNDGFKSTLVQAAIKHKQDWYMLTPVEQSRLVFELLDRDNSGTIDAGELQSALTAWSHNASVNTLN